MHGMLKEFEFKKDRRMPIVIENGDMLTGCEIEVNESENMTIVDEKVSVLTENGAKNMIFVRVEG